MRVRPDNRRYPAIEIPAQGNLFRSGLGMEIHEDDFGLDLLQKLVGNAKGIIIRSHEHASLQIYHGVRNLVLVTLIDAPPWHISRIICRTEQSPVRAVAVALDHLKIIQNLALVPDVVAGGNDVDVELKQFLRECRRDAEAGS